MSKLDATGDVSRQAIHTYSKLYEFPQYVKQASEAESLAPQDLPSTAYADPRHREFPCHTKAACWLSTLFFLEKRSEMHVKRAQWVARGLEAFAHHYGIKGDIKAAKARHDAMNKTSSATLPDSAYAIVWAGDDGSKDRRYPLTNAREVKVASEWFSEHRDHFIFLDRQTIAQKILEKAAQFGTMIDEDIDHMLQKQAGYGVYDPAEASTMIRNRAMMKRVPEPVRERLMKLASDVDGNPRLAEDPTSSAMLAATIDQFDRNVVKLSSYSPSFPRPEDVLFKGSTKQASQFVKSACATLTGAIYNRSQFSKLSVAHVRQAFGNDIADAVTSGIAVDGEKMADVASTLPLPDAVMLDNLMQGIGQGPIRTKAAAIGVSEEDRQKLSEEYKFASGLPEVEGELGAPTGVGGSRVIGGAV